MTTSDHDHASHDHHRHHPHGGAGAADTTATDPVCGMKVDPQTARHRATPAGQPY
jgi:Cu+-exporting ATPase